MVWQCRKRDNSVMVMICTCDLSRLDTSNVIKCCLYSKRTASFCGASIATTLSQVNILSFVVIVIFAAL
jgi:hypothetical protein